MTTRADQDRQRGHSGFDSAATLPPLLEEISRNLFETLPEALVIVDGDGRIVLLNTSAERLLGYQRAELVGKMVEVLVPSQRAAGHAELRAHYAADPAQRRMGTAMGLKALRKDGTSVAVDIALSPLDSSLGTLTVCTIRDATERTATIEELAASESRFRTLADQATDGIAISDSSGHYLAVNNAACAMLGYRREEFLSKSIVDLIAPEEVERLPHEIARLSHGTPVRSEWRFRRADGTIIEIEINARQLDDSRLLAVMRDVTERNRQADEQRRSRRFVEAVAKASPSWIYVFDLDELALGYLNRSILRDLGYPEDVERITTLEQFRAFLADDHAVRLASLLADWRSLADDQVHEGEYRIRDAAGALRWCFGRETVFSRHPDGRVHQILGTLTDITSLKLASDRLLESEARFRTLIEDLDVGVLLQDATDDSILLSNHAAESMLGMTAERLDRMSSHKWPWRLLREDGTDYPRDALPSVVAARTGVAVRGQIVGSLNTETGECRWLQVTATPRLGLDGNVRHVLVAMTDVTHHRLLEQQLRQSQKMQAIGQLAGGVAHDFNNLLTVISGCTELALMDLPDELPSVKADIAAIRSAAERAAMLTRQLLLFGRKGVWQETVVDFNDVVRRASQMLSRLIGETIVTDTQLAPTLPAVRGDATQFEQIVVNLALNARDAMPNGGHLFIQTTEEVLPETVDAAGGTHQAGHYVRLSVRDTGMGIPAELRAHLFEPFFTTKGPGKGTGLGLSTVYGIAQQAGGFITVDSEVGAGSTFSVFIPAIADLPADNGSSKEAPDAAKGTETVLVVEDEHPLRSVIVRALKSHGYRAIDASSGEEALELLRRDPQHKIDVLLTDVIMPGLGGQELAQRARVLRPGLAVLFMSGYSSEHFSREGLLTSGEHLLQKPFTPQVLASKMREVLDARR